MRQGLFQPLFFKALTIAWGLAQVFAPHRVHAYENPSEADQAIELHSSQLQALCDAKRIKLRQEFIEEVFLPVRNEFDSLLSGLSREQKMKLDRELGMRPSIQAIRAKEQTQSLAEQVFRKILERSEGQRHLLTELKPGNPFPSLRISGKNAIWRDKSYQVRISFEGNPGDSGYHYRVEARKSQHSAQAPSLLEKKSGNGLNELHEIIESELPVQCRIFLTGLDLDAIYQFPANLPKFRTEGELRDPNRHDPNRIISSILVPSQHLKNRNGPEVSTSRFKAGSRIEEQKETSAVRKARAVRD